MFLGSSLPSISERRRIHVIDIRLIPGHHGYTLVALTWNWFALFVRDASPATGFGRIFDPLHCWEVVIVLFHSNHPGDIIECHGLESEVYFYISAGRGTALIGRTYRCYREY